MEQTSTPSVLGQYRRLLVGLVLIIGVSSFAMVIAAGGTRTEAIIVGVVGIGVGVVVAAYLVHLLGQLRRR